MISASSLEHWLNQAKKKKKKSSKEIANYVVSRYFEELSEDKISLSSQFFAACGIIEDWLTRDPYVHRVTLQANDEETGIIVKSNDTIILSENVHPMVSGMIAIAADIIKSDYDS